MTNLGLNISKSQWNILLNYLRHPDCILNKAQYDVFIAIKGYTKNGTSICFIKHSKMAESLMYDPIRLTKIIGKLKKMNLIKVIENSNFNRHIMIHENIMDIVPDKFYKQNKKEIDEMENLDESIFSDKPIEQKQTKDIGSIIKPTQRVLEPEMEAFEKIRKAYYQPRISNKKKEYKLYLELSKEERLLAFINLEQYLELNKDNHDFISSLANYLESKKFSNENIEFLKKIKNKPKKDKNTSETKLTSDQWKTKYLD